MSSAAARTCSVREQSRRQPVPHCETMEAEAIDCENTNFTNFKKILKIHEFLRILKMPTNFKNKIRLVTLHIICESCHAETTHRN